MGMILKNEELIEDIFMLEIEGKYEGKAGQFYMIKVDNTPYPLLSRPVSIFEITPDSIKFLYKVVGEGTKILSEKKKGDLISIRGPYGNGFPSAKGKVALVGGGMGAAPLYETAKQLMQDHEVNAVDLYLGFSHEIILEDSWRKVCSSFLYDIGGIITDHVDVSKYDVILSCGPDIMMRKLSEQGKRAGVPVYVSVESHMACGIGACLACSCQTKYGNKKVCKDGPVFLGEDIYDV